MVASGKDMNNRVRGIYIFGSCYQATTSEDVEDFMCAVVTVIFRVCKLVRLVVTCSYEL
jgi:hypothetical protein